MPGLLKFRLTRALGSRRRPQYLVCLGDVIGSLIGSCLSALVSSVWSITSASTSKTSVWAAGSAGIRVNDRRRSDELLMNEYVQAAAVFAMLCGASSLFAKSQWCRDLGGDTALAITPELTPAVSALHRIFSLG